MVPCCQNSSPEVSSSAFATTNDTTCLSTGSGGIGMNPFDTVVVVSQPSIPVHHTLLSTTSISPFDNTYSANAPASQPPLLITTQQQFPSYTASTKASLPSSSVVNYPQAFNPFL